MDIYEKIREMGCKARAASRTLALLDTARRNAILVSMAEQIEADEKKILAANAIDVAAAQEKGLTSAMIDRLRLDAKRVSAIAEALRDVAKLPDPVGEIIRQWTRPNGLEISKVRTPIGVVGIIYESRPNVTADAASLCIKTGNATILRGGSESIHSNTAIAEALVRGGEGQGLPVGALQLVPVTDREAVKALAEMDEFLDVIVPRGGQALISAVMEHARMPVIKHYNGICSVYVDCAADIAMAVDIAVNSKCQRPGTCNAMETLLVNHEIAEQFWAVAIPQFSERNVKIHADSATYKHLEQGGYPDFCKAVETDWSTEYLDLEMAVREVRDVAEAVEHINNYGSHHSDAIVTNESERGNEFLSQVDSAAVYWNASTRFTDGGEFGFGAEIGISTDKLHARGPMGLEELTTYKYTVRGTGQLRH